MASTSAIRLSSAVLIALLLALLAASPAPASAGRSWLSLGPANSALVRWNALHWDDLDDSTDLDMRGRVLHGGPHGSSDPEADPAPTEQDSSLTANKIGALVLFLVAPLIGCFIPRLVPIPQRVLSYLVLFAAGLFFTIAAEHMMEDSNLAYDYLLPENLYPFAFMTFVGGFFLTWLADITARVAGTARAQRKSRGSNQGAAAAGAAAGPADASRVESNEGTEKTLMVEDVTGRQSAGIEVPLASGSPSKGPGDSITSCGVPSWAEYEDPIAAGKSSAYDLTLLQTVLLLLALSFHGVYDGIAVGLTTSVSAMWQMSITVVLYSFLEAFSLGVVLVARKRDSGILIFFLYACVFAVMVPIGVAIGIVHGGGAPASAAVWVEAVGNALAAGVFVFVAVGHLLMKAMRPTALDMWWTPFLKWGSAAAGVLAVSLILLLE